MSGHSFLDLNKLCKILRNGHAVHFLNDLDKCKFQKNCIVDSKLLIHTFDLYSGLLSFAHIPDFLYVFLCAHDQFR